MRLTPNISLQLDIQLHQKHKWIIYANFLNGTTHNVLNM